jgi:hypothetical protein
MQNDGVDKMRLQTFPLTAIVLAMTFPNNLGFAQNLYGHEPSGHTSALDSVQTLNSLDSGHDYVPNSEPVAAGFVRSVPSGASVPTPFRPFSRIGIDSHTGLGGVGFDVATPLSKAFNLRAGSDFFRYATSFQEQGANVAVNLHMQAAHASLDWFPFGGRFRLSPLVVFANNNRVEATALIPSGSTVTLDGQDFISSLSDPLHGGGSVEFRKVSPGFSLGFGDIIPRTKDRLSFPIEAGFYYAGQPDLKVNFSGSACDPAQPPVVGCQTVSQDATFQKNLAAFIARNNHNLSYASFFPIFSMGFGYAF